jgi:hypothetical protein
MQYRGGVSGFITNDARILDSPREMVALQHTNLKLVVTDGVGHDALRATGLILTYMVEIARDPASSAFYRLRPGGKQVVTAGRQVNVIAARGGLQPTELIGNELAAMRERLAEHRPHLLDLLP